MSTWQENKFALPLCAKRHLQRPFLRCQGLLEPLDQAAAAIQQAMVVREAVLVGTVRRGRDGQGDFREDPGLEDALDTDQGNALALPDQALGEDIPRQDIAMARLLGFEPLEGCFTNRGVLLVGVHSRRVAKIGSDGKDSMDHGGVSWYPSAHDRRRPLFRRYFSLIRRPTSGLDTPRGLDRACCGVVGSGISTVFVHTSQVPQLSGLSSPKYSRIA